VAGAEGKGGGRGGAAALLSLEAMVDSAFLWALVLDRLRAGIAMGAALAQTVEAVEAAGGTGRFNFLLTDGHSIAATACGDTLWYRPSGEGASASATVASEPSDDEPGWTEVPDRHLLTATARGVRVRPLAAGVRTGAAGEAASGGLPRPVPAIDSEVSTEGIATR
jgi:glutamine amidotransferase